MRKRTGWGVVGGLVGFVGLALVPQMAAADAIPADGQADGSGHWVSARYDLVCNEGNRLFLDANVVARIVDTTGTEVCKGAKLEISNRSAKSFHYGVARSVSATLLPGQTTTIDVQRPSDPEASTRVELNGRHFEDCGAGRMWKNGVCKDWEDPCPAGDSRADITDLWQAQNEDWHVAATQWRVMNECYDDKGKLDTADADCKRFIADCEEASKVVHGNQHDHSTVQDAAFADMRKTYLGQTYTVFDKTIFDEPDNSMTCSSSSRETMKKRSLDRQAISTRHWKVSVEYSRWLQWKQQVNRECSIKNNQAPKQMPTFTPRQAQAPVFGPSSGRKHVAPAPPPVEPVRPTPSNLARQEQPPPSAPSKSEPLHAAPPSTTPSTTTTTHAQPLNAPASTRTTSFANDLARKMEEDRRERERLQRQESQHRLQAEEQRRAEEDRRRTQQQQQQLQQQHQLQQQQLQLQLQHQQEEARRRQQDDQRRLQMEEQRRQQQQEAQRRQQDEQRRQQMEEQRRQQQEELRRRQQDEQRRQQMEEQRRQQEEQRRMQQRAQPLPSFKRR